MFPSGMDVDAGSVAYDIASRNDDKLKALEERVVALEAAVSKLREHIPESKGNG